MMTPPKWVAARKAKAHHDELVKFAQWVATELNGFDHVLNGADAEVIVKEYLSEA